MQVRPYPPLGQDPEGPPKEHEVWGSRRRQTKPPLIWTQYRPGVQRVPPLASGEPQANYFTSLSLNFPTCKMDQ